jgi:7-cyano-7-deazaguanine synthase
MASGPSSFVLPPEPPLLVGDNSDSKLAVAVVSGGLDSVTLAHLLHARGWNLSLLAIDYGQRHKRELALAQACAQRLGAEIHTVDLTGLRPLLKGSALTDDVVVPHGHYAAPSMAATIVPNRNAIFLAVAYAAAVAAGAQLVAIGVHAGDHPVYPDCRPAFIESFAAMQKIATEGSGDARLELYAPFLNMGKHDIVRLGADLGVPFVETWSCYEGGALHCGNCGTCVERREAFALAGVPDPTEYEVRSR